MSGFVEGIDRCQSSLFPAERRQDERIKRVRIWHEVVRETAGSLGFESSSRLPGRYSAVFRHALTPRWNFALGVDARGLGTETADTVAKPPGMGPLPVGQHLTWMALVPKGKSGISFGDPELIFVPQYFVLFDRAYGIFWDMEGLEINVRAHMAALALLWAEMKPRLVDGVSDL